ncbi:MAG TPA: maltose alpha-D-glucosyltransferase [Chloroflexota bacterium]|nr:maltose alpha-D-glucosyltransferase [Chloroflexota bacterium]
MSAPQPSPGLTSDPLWYKDAIIYELHVRAFYDSDGDGIGDFRGLTQKLDYLQDLGVTALWLLPFYPSPLKDDGYDIADYTNVHPAYGTLRDVRQFVREAHRRGLRVITELVCNHTSDQHAWFQRARRAPRGSAARNWYVWSDTTERYKEARIIFKDFEHSNWAWDPVAQQYYWHRFYSHQPDLNFDNPQVQRAIFKVIDFWLEMGIDGLRLDAVPYLYEREGTNCENLPETHAYLKALRRHVDSRFADRMLLAEANQWPEDAVAYFGDGDECHMAFHFPLMPRMFMAVRMEDRYPIVDILNQTPPIPPNAQWALFLRNHDELTLEMVTDEERDYMYRMYARDPQMRINLGIRRRLAPLLGNHRRRIELLNGLLFSLPGTPVIYYGDEIGMGDNIYLGDRDGVRTPMQWSADRNAGFSTADRQRLYKPVIVDLEYHYEAVNVQAQQANPHSLLWWMKRLIALRKRHRAFGRGSLEFLHPANRKVLAFVREYQDERILVVANLSRFAQPVELDLRPWQDLVPVEMFGRTPFPPIRDAPYFLTLGPHSFYWFLLEPERVALGTSSPARVGWEAEVRPAPELAPTLTLTDGWEELVVGRARPTLASLLPNYLRARRWFGGKARTIQGARVLDAIPLPTDNGSCYLTLVQVEYTEGDPETYCLPLACTDGDDAETLLRDHPEMVVARVQGERARRSCVVYDALAKPAFGTALVEALLARRRLRGLDGELQALPTTALRRLVSGRALPPPTLLRAEQSNTTLVFGDRLLLKVFRRLEPGINPDAEVGAYLTEIGFPHTPPFGGTLEYHAGRELVMTVGTLHGYVANQGDAWQYTLDALDDYLERASTAPPEQQQAIAAAPPPATATLLELAADEPPPLAHETIGAYLGSAALLGQRTAELHCALAAPTTNPEFAPEPFTPFYQRSLFQSMRALVGPTFEALRQRLDRLPAAAQAEARALLGQESVILARLRAVTTQPLPAARIRIHGDYHLGQVLYTGGDFVILDFEGEPVRPLSERRLKRSPLRDVAGLLRSFHYATAAALIDRQNAGLLSEEALPQLTRWAAWWQLWVSAQFLRAYLTTLAREAPEGPPLLPARRDQVQVLLDAFLLEKAVYEIGYELSMRPSWVAIPLRGLRALLGV